MRALGPLVVILVSCGGSSTPRTPAAPASPAGAPAAAAEPTAPPKAPPPEETFPDLPEIPPALRVLEAGAAPRRKLRYKLRAGAPEYLELDMKMTMAMALPQPGGAALETTVEAPTVRTTIRTAVAELAPEGTALVRYDLESISILGDGKLDPDARRTFETEMAGLNGMRGSTRLSPRGEQSETVFEMPNASPGAARQMDSMRDSFRHVYLLLPEDEVGVGATWETTSRTPMAGIMADWKARYTVTRFAGATVELAFTIEVSAPRQAIAVDAGMKGRLDMLAGKGSGTLALALDRLTNTSAMTMGVELSVTVTSGTESSSSVVKVNNVTSTRPGKPPGKPPKRR